MLYDVRVEQAIARPIAVVRRKARQDELSTVVPAACGEVWQFLRSTNTPNTGLNLAVYLDLEMNLEIGVVVTEPIAGSGSVIGSATPAGPAATAVHFGPYNRLGEAHDAIRAWCKDRSYPLAGPFWEIYGHWNDDASKLRTDVYYLLEGGAPVAGEPALTG
jgi:effector-binding domain-containing protein